MEQHVRHRTVHDPVTGSREEDAVLKLVEAVTDRVDRLSLIFQLRDLQDGGESYAIDSLQAAYSLS